MRFGFGKNWERYIKEHFSEERVEISKDHMLKFLETRDLQGKYFLDVGCGSGLHSLAALRAGAARIVSFDYDQDAVDTTRKLKEYAGNPHNWEIEQGSILDQEFLRGLQPADIVYSWGVLHHTGEMWRAFRNTVELMKEDGCFYVALYVGEPYFGHPMEFWLEVKQNYNRANWPGRKRMECWYFWEFFLDKQWKNISGLIKQAREYKKSRGMDIYRDAVDWLGGWPMEYASVDHVKRFAIDGMGLALLGIKTGQANAEYLFARPPRSAIDAQQAHSRPPGTPK